MTSVPNNQCLLHQLIMWKIFYPFRLNLFYGNTDVTQNQYGDIVDSSGIEFGVAGPGNVFIHFLCCNLLIGKFGVYTYIYKAYHGGCCSFIFNFIFARIIAIIEVILYIPAVIFFIIVYALLFLFFLIGGICSLITYPCKFRCHGCLCGSEVYNNRDICKHCWLSVCQIFVAFLSIIVHLILAIPQIIIPEFTALLLQQHKW